MTDCIFCKIANHEIKKEFTYEDEEVMVFPDIHPIKPVHLLIIPKKHVIDFMGLDDNLAIKMKNVIQKMVRKENLEDKGFRLVVNGGGAQIINHLHVHFMGPMGLQVKDM